MTEIEARRSTVKTILWAIVGIFAVATFARFKSGLGATTGLSNVTPWGFWIAFDVMAGVALAAGGFALAAAVYIFRIERYRSFTRPAILTAFLGYAAVTAGLVYDLGLPWRIWHPIIYPQLHSVLFEVAMCVMMYLTVLFLEFSPVILEHPRFDRPVFRAIHRLLKRITIPLVILGIILSTLHQSSLGSLFLIAPYRVNPLWYSPIIWILFFVSAVGLGLMMVALESIVSAWLFGHKVRQDLLGGLGKVASVVLFLYATLRVGDLAWRGKLGAAFDGSFLGALFLFELAVGAVVPAILLAIPRVRASSRGVGVAAVLTVLGTIGYRFNVCVVAFKRPDVMSYFPSLVELGVSLGIVASAGLLFIFFVEKLRVYPEEHWEAPALKVPSYEPLITRMLLPHSLAAPRRYSLAFILAAAVTVAVLPRDALLGPQPERTPVAGPRIVEGLLETRPDAHGHDLAIEPADYPVPPKAVRAEFMVIDGNRNGRLVLFPHDEHVARLGDKQSCVKCHHENLPYERNSACSECHRDMYIKTDIFEHEVHVEKLNGDSGCVRCHENPDQLKSRDTATSCTHCHTQMVVTGSRIKPPKKGMTGYAPGYMDAMHGLCIGCHEEKVKTDPATYSEDFSRCAQCHRDTNGSELRKMAPYAPQGTVAGLAKPGARRLALRYRSAGGESGTFGRE
jgi:Ni/Fe-hydrogenase subunit HybB-like protein